jgi:antitoxin VapB
MVSYHASAMTDELMDTAAVVYEGECQTVRLPKGFHLPTAVVGVRHDGEAIVLEPLKPKSWPEGFFDSIHISDPAFARPAQAHLPPVKSL